MFPVYTVNFQADSCIRLKSVLKVTDYNKHKKLISQGSAALSLLTSYPECNMSFMKQ